MKAAIYTRYGPPDVVRITDVEQPVPKDKEVLIKVRAASVNPLDWHFLRGTPRLGRIVFGLGRPKNPRLGVDVAGQVEISDFLLIYLISLSPQVLFPLLKARVL